MQKILDGIAQSIFDKKGFNILALDVRGISTLTDYFLIAEGSVDRHVKALTNAATEAAEERGLQLLHVEGKESSGWVVLDFGELIIHLFIPELREKYTLEKVWHEGKIIDLNIQLEPAR